MQALAERSLPPDFSPSKKQSSWQEKHHAKTWEGGQLHAHGDQESTRAYSVPSAGALWDMAS